MNGLSRSSAGHRALAAALACGAAALSPTDAAAQVSDVRAAAALFPDTVHVGQPLRLGVTVSVPRGMRVRFPFALSAGEDLEQVGEAEIGKRRTRSGTARAYYRLVAWRAGEHEVPSVRVEVLPDGGESEAFEIVVPVPTLVVESVLPANITGLELRQALPFLTPLPFPLLLLIALAALILGWWAYRRFGSRAAEGETPARELTAWEAALEELKRLVEEWRAGVLSPAAFCDRLEAILKRYLVVTEAWVPGVPARAVANGDGRLRRALEFSARVRFARLGAGYGGPIEASDACGAWIASRHPRDEDDPAEPSPASAAGPAGEVS